MKVKNHAGVGDAEMLQQSLKSESEYRGESQTRRTKKKKENKVFKKNETGLELT